MVVLHIEIFCISISQTSDDLENSAEMEEEKVRAETRIRASTNQHVAQMKLRPRKGRTEGILSMEDED
ncbi:hypothetical protein E3N88_18381 [Mikania micrantha]|uniref:Uncharacterized protein n=1 Tax=Mikania micrantha TaxID=192012 RepID=A0A5N6NMP7_9ASTR|nr:hypothetical protein E3N88_18381 [Mikania micrantha]